MENPNRRSAFSFLPTTPILDYGPRYAVKPDKGARWIGWPVWVWRVLIPLRQERRLNVFQRAVLKLALAGIRFPEDQAERLGLNKALVALIFTELQHLGAMDKHHALTSHGKRILDEDSTVEDKMSSGYVFQDPFVEDLWPRFTDRLQIAETTFSPDNQFPKLTRGRLGTPRLEPVHLVLSKSMTPSQPRRANILDAMVQYLRDQKFVRQKDDGNPLFQDEASLAYNERRRMSETPADRIEYVDTVPKPYFLLSRIYYPASKPDVPEWRVCDPWGLGDSPTLRRHIETHMANDPKLQNLVGNVVQINDEERIEWQRILDRRRQEAETNIKTILTAGILDHPQLFDALLRMEEKRLAINAAKDLGRPVDIRDFLIAAQRVVETLAHRWLEEHPDRGKSKLLSNGERARDYNQRLFETFAMDCGFHVPLPKRLAAVRHGKVHYALGGKGGSLRPLILALLLTADNNPEHPIRRWAKGDPDLLQKIDELATLRDKAAHASSETFPVEKVAIQRECVLDAVALGLGLPKPRNTGKDSTTP